MSQKTQAGGDSASNLRRLAPAKPIQVIAVSAGKGGVGKSNVAVNLALGLAQLNKKVMLLDADLGLANVDIMLGLDVQYNLSHVVRDVCHLSDIILPGPYGLSVIPAASGSDFMAQLSTLELAGIIDAFNELTDELEYMIIDTAAGISDTVLSFLRSSQELIVLVCDEPTSLVGASALIKVMHQRYEWTRFHILANMIRSEQKGRELFNKLFHVSEQFVGVQLDYLGGLPFDEHIPGAVKIQKPVLLAYPESVSALSFKRLAEDISEWSPNSLLGGNTSFFLERLVASGL